MNYTGKFSGQAEFSDCQFKTRFPPHTRLMEVYLWTATETMTYYILGSIILWI